MLSTLDSRMSLLARLVDGATPLHGGGIIRRLHGYGGHGDEKIESFLRDSVLQGVCVPLYHMISRSSSPLLTSSTLSTHTSPPFRWVLHGELYDPYQEFFISTNSTNPFSSSASSPSSSSSLLHSLSVDSSTIDYVWHKYYTLTPSLLPPFLSLSLAKKILVVGKSINFLKACSKYSDRITASSSSAGARDTLDDPFSLPTLPLLTSSCQSIQQMSYGSESELEQIIYSIARVIESSLLNIVQNQFHLSVHLSALKKFLLLGQGDFVTCLLDNIGLSSPLHLIVTDSLSLSLCLSLRCRAETKSD
jgi:gamma-tubulin complex component 3